MLDRIGEPIVWDFFRSEWDYLVGRFSLNDRLFGKSVATITNRYIDGFGKRPSSTSHSLGHTKSFHLS